MSTLPKEMAKVLIKEFWHSAFTDENAFAWAKMNAIKCIKMAHRFNEERHDYSSDVSYDNTPEYKYLSEVRKELNNIK